jgi:hypothetical protein
MSVIIPAHSQSVDDSDDSCSLSFFQRRMETLNANDAKYPLVYEHKDPVGIGEKRHRKKNSKRHRHAEKSRKK